MSQLNWEQLAGVNLEYRLYPFEYFLAAQQKLGVRTIELWGGAPHFLLGYDEMQDCAAMRRQVAVSYTHLDVYKRQNQCTHGRDRSAIQLSGAFLPSADRLFCLLA